MKDVETLYLLDYETAGGEFLLDAVLKQTR